MIWFRAKDSVGGTPTDAVDTTALPEKSLMIGATIEFQEDCHGFVPYPLADSAWRIPLESAFKENAELRMIYGTAVTRIGGPSNRTENEPCYNLLRKAVEDQPIAIGLVGNPISNDAEYNSKFPAGANLK